MAKQITKTKGKVIKEAKKALKVIAEVINEEALPVIEHKKETKIKWEVPKECEITYFDAEISYEISHYRPINDKEGLDFNPEWFIETRLVYESTGKYCSALNGSKRFFEFWRELFIRCKYGYEVNGYRITGFHYFFLNFYQLPLTNQVKTAGSGRPSGFPNFTVAQYEWFHYLDLCCKLLKNAALMKTRGCG